MPAQSRQLAAIIFTDIVRYTAVMGEKICNNVIFLVNGLPTERSIIQNVCDLDWTSN